MQGGKRADEAAHIGSDADGSRNLLALRKRQCQPGTPPRRRTNPPMRRHLKINRRRRLAKCSPNRLQRLPTPPALPQLRLRHRIKTSNISPLHRIHSISPFQDKVLRRSLETTPRKRTNSRHLGRSASCQKLTHATQQFPPPLVRRHSMNSSART